MATIKEASLNEKLREANTLRNVIGTQVDVEALLNVFGEQPLRGPLRGKADLENIRNDIIAVEKAKAKIFTTGESHENFDGKATEFDSFWELFKELVHKQPYSNIEKLSILLNRCKGDAAKTLKMIPRTGNSYEEAVNQLKLQYQDAKRTTMTMIRQLKNMKQAKDDARSLRNTLSDIETIIATLRRNGEFVDTTQMSSMVIDTFPKTIQEKIL
ncbi:unnamed protein product [Cylicocyclus nassatus]|uniref:Uncharacterized protein n=1 Tax=Cylicocyclus nassatus TaxID=53992 RepID=A0AA36GRI2_CYLNA|nr:unnamed protein product [Cylicocyclus nassatus]